MARSKCVVFVLIKNNRFMAERRPDTERVDPGRLALPVGT